jgi:hypothetical protein
MEFYIASVIAVAARTVAIPVLNPVESGHFTLIDPIYLSFVFLYTIFTA